MPMSPTAVRAVFAHMLGLALIGWATLVQAAPQVASVESPGKVLKVSLVLDGGTARYRVERLGDTVVEDSKLGFALRDGRLDRDFTLLGQQRRSVDDTWEQPWGERRLTRNDFNELTVQLAETTGSKRRLDVVFRVYDDGLGFRYVFPEQPNLREAIIDDELTEFAIAQDSTAWWIPAGEPIHYEYLYQRTPLREVPLVHTPMTLRSRDGLHVAIHEAALVDYAGMWLRRSEGQRLRAQLSPSAEGWKVRRTLPFATPWRTLQIADRAGGLVESDLILNLNEPNALGDVSWVKPAKYLGVWWSMHLDNESWATGPKHAATTAKTKKVIDFAAAHGFRGVLVEGWNPGWDGMWVGNGYDFDFTRATPDFDIEALSAYGLKKGVHLIGHHETGCAIEHYEAQLDAALDLYARLGVDQFKTGYVCDDGQVDRRNPTGGPLWREWHDGQFMARHHLKVVQEAARRHLSVNPHEPIKDTGLRRTYPNWISREGARGMEYNAWGQPPNPPEHEVNLVFTRMLAGPMDYTPGILSLKGRHGQAIPSTLARQLALYVVLYSPIQMAADLPEHYLQHREAFRFIEDVAVDWEQSRVLDGEVGDYVTIVRRDRNSRDWFLGSITDEHGRVLPVSLGFLEPGVRYRAEIYRDGEGADFRSNPFAFVRETREVTSADALTLVLAPGGGQAIRFTPIR
ncbi:glycoside hydrolase family 97 protein [Stenotrophomonas maltophilia]|uniref:glycoside hydrolase family 97 protein n=1 Tax=Stenotrophomonas TaxID=40323 RepID=UPI000D4225BE|nr:glycoside hydrolase family 97 protein [Stenotrophomonas maltophilia]MBA0225831.1 glycoside hydrolase family 97 protein [Stenotrophomonas maltophilia]MBA0366740.1 glycoside hydrolase family 97 protein [Stenotrophomonas maltophilia]MBA0404861.1 glycoside hydrolase family 97 protein [Stenotrophomonas maltophilia]MCF3522109.1 glycoside hydrolase family 97 protein [Stenotrophomonas maltophilia]PSD13706.1 alpha-glucosidase [Stenotrophomonas maltophilia]